MKLFKSFFLGLIQAMEEGAQRRADYHLKTRGYKLYD